MDPNKELCKAIQKESLIEVKKAIGSGATPHARIDYTEFFTPWHWIYSCRNLAIIMYLLDNGAEADYPLTEIDNETALFGAILGNKPRIIRLLVDNGADINAMSNYGETPLYYALKLSKEHLELIPLLLELGADITIGAHKFTKLKKNGSEDFKSFCNYIFSFLKQLEKTSELDLLQEQTDRIMKLSKTLEFLPSLMNLTRKLRFMYCLENELDQDPNLSETDKLLRAKLWLEDDQCNYELMSTAEEEEATSQRITLDLLKDDKKKEDEEFEIQKCLVITNEEGEEEKREEIEQFNQTDKIMDEISPDDLRSDRIVSLASDTLQFEHELNKIFGTEDQPCPSDYTSEDHYKLFSFVQMNCPYIKTQGENENKLDREGNRKRKEDQERNPQKNDSATKTDKENRNSLYFINLEYEELQKKLALKEKEKLGEEEWVLINQFSQSALNNLQNFENLFAVSSDRTLLIECIPKKEKEQRHINEIFRSVRYFYMTFKTHLQRNLIKIFGEKGQGTTTTNFISSLFDNNSLLLNQTKLEKINWDYLDKLIKKYKEIDSLPKGVIDEEFSRKGLNIITSNIVFKFREGARKKIQERALIFPYDPKDNFILSCNVSSQENESQVQTVKSEVLQHVNSNKNSDIKDDNTTNALITSLSSNIEPLTKQAINEISKQNIKIHSFIDLGLEIFSLKWGFFYKSLKQKVEHIFNKSLHLFQTAFPQIQNFKTNNDKTAQKDYIPTKDSPNKTKSLRTKKNGSNILLNSLKSFSYFSLPFFEKALTMPDSFRQAKTAFYIAPSFEMTEDVKRAILTRASHVNKDKRFTSILI